MSWSFSSFAARAVLYETAFFRRIPSAARGNFHCSRSAKTAETVVLSSYGSTVRSYHPHATTGSRHNRVLSVFHRELSSGSVPGCSSVRDDWPEHDFLKLAEFSLETISELVAELYVDSDSAPSDFDVDLSQGVLTISLGEDGTYVLNTQTPNRQIWMSSPASGPWRYCWRAEDRQWVSTRDGHSLSGRLGEELSAIFQQPVTITFGEV